MSKKVRQDPICVGLLSITGLMWLFMTNTATGQTAEAFYTSDVESIVQGKCIRCHRSGGQASYTELRFTSSASENHAVFDSFVNSPTKGARANTVLSKIRGALGHGGGQVISQGSADYRTFSAYIDLLPDDDEPAATAPGAPVIVSVTAGDSRAVVNFTAPADDGGATISSYAATSSPDARSATCSASPCTVGGLTNGQSYRFSVTATNVAGEGPASDLSDPVVPVAASVFRVALEEPVKGQFHTGVGNLRGWAIASEGITKVEILVDGVLAFEAPYGGERGDVGGAFPDVAGSSESGFSLAYNYSSLSAGPHTITAVAHNALGETKKSAARFEVVRFDSPFISDPNAVNLNNASCTVSSDEISIVDALVEGSVYDLRLKWRTAEQGFEIIEIR